MKIKVKDVMAVMEKHFPLHLAEDWDNVGLQIGSVNKEVKKIAVALDLDNHILNEALKLEADMIITHHPLIFKPLKKIEYNNYTGKLIKNLITSDIAVYSAHTNLDAAEKGMNQVLAEKIGLVNIEPLYNGQEDKLIKLAVFVPLTHLDQVRLAIHEAGAGFIGNYSDCSFRTGGIGTFRPQEGAEPYLGSKDILEEVEEYRLETILYQHDAKKVVNAMLAAHPYEEAAYDIYPLLNRGKMYSIGRKGLLPEKTDLKTCAQMVKTKLGLNNVRIAGEMEKEISRVAVIGGAGASLINRIVKNEIDLVVTGDMKYHEAQEANRHGIAILDAGHQETEQIVVPYLAELLKQDLYNLNCQGQILVLKNHPVFKLL